LPAPRRLATIYRQPNAVNWNWTKQTEKGQDVIKNKREEDFAVAAVAFVLKHDEIFKRHFLENVCGIKDATENLAGYEVRLHPHDFDLVLVNERKNEVVVLEFKVGVDLAAHQKYFGTDFFKTDFPQGYGYRINEKHYANYSSRKYIVLQKREEFKSEQVDEGGESVPVKGIQCSSRSWLDLFPGNSNETALLVEDLLDSLALSFGINELKSRLFMKKKLAESTQHAAEIYEILKRAAEVAGDKLAKPIGRKVENGYEFGVELNKNSIGGFEFLKANQSPDRFIWFGYEPSAGGGNAVRISVWICALHEKEKRNQVNERIKKEITGYEIDETTDATGLIIYSDGRRVGDLEWFNEVLNFLKNLK
jgi:hypothetical protein